MKVLLAEASLDMMAGYIQLLNDTSQDKQIQFSCVMQWRLNQVFNCYSWFFASQLANPCGFQQASLSYNLVFRWCGASTFDCFCVMVGPLLVLKLIYNGGSILHYEFERAKYCGTLCRYLGIISAQLHINFTLFIIVIVCR